MRGGCAIGAMGQKADAPVVRAARRSLSQQRAPYRWPGHISTQEMHFICETQTADGINFANLSEGCSGSPEYTHACHDTRPRLGKNTTPSPPHARLTRFSVRGFAKFIPLKPPPIRAMLWCSVTTQLCIQGERGCVSCESCCTTSSC